MGRLFILISVGLVHTNMKPREITNIVHMMSVTHCVSLGTHDIQKTGIRWRQIIPF